MAGLRFLSALAFCFPREGLFWKSGGPMWQGIKEFTEALMCCLFGLSDDAGTRKMPHLNNAEN